MGLEHLTRIVYFGQGVLGSGPSGTIKADLRKEIRFYVRK